MVENVVGLTATNSFLLAAGQRGLAASWLVVKFFDNTINFMVVQLTIELRTLYSNAPGTHWNLIGNPNYQMPLEPKYKQ